MTEVCYGSDARTKRQLPGWMLKSSPCKAEPKCKNKAGLKSTEPVHDQIKPGKRQSRRSAVNKIDDFDEIDELAGKLAGEPIRACRNSKARNRKRSLTVAKSETLILGITDDEVELTVDDLVRIAGEYVNADEKLQKKQRIDEGPQPLHATKQLNGLSRCTTSKAISRQDARLKETNESSTSSAAIVASADVAQDMLDLFLGPLLRKPQETEPDTIETRHTSPIKPAEHKAAPAKDNVLREEAGGVDVAKKRSSLKDMVALLLH